MCADFADSVPDRFVFGLVCACRFSGDTAVGRCDLTRDFRYHRPLISAAPTVSHLMIPNRGRFLISIRLSASYAWVSAVRESLRLTSHPPGPVIILISLAPCGGVSAFQMGRPYPRSVRSATWVLNSSCSGASARPTTGAVVFYRRFLSKHRVGRDVVIRRYLGISRSIN